MYRIGKSTDIHQLVANRPLVIGGVKIPSPLGLQGHSDADILCHAIAEAILGALNLKDLGTHFSDQDEKNKNRCSLTILQEVVIKMEKKNYEINNVDSLILIEKPKMAPYIEQMQQNIATILHTSIDNINIKATCGEGLGFIGKQQGAVAEAIVLLRKKD